MDWPKVGERITFIELALVARNKFRRTARDKAIINVNGEDGNVGIVVGCKDSGVGCYDKDLQTDFYLFYSVY